MNGIDILENAIIKRDTLDGFATVAPMITAFIGAGGAFAQQAIANKAQKNALNFQRQQLQSQENIAISQAETQRANLEFQRVKALQEGVGSPITTDNNKWIWIAGGIGFIAIAGIATTVIILKSKKNK